MKIIKRSGAEVVFDRSKIEKAVAKANEAGTVKELTDEQIAEIAKAVEDTGACMYRALSVEEIQELV